MCHIFEYKNEPDRGIKYLRDTERNWSICEFVAPHNYWHLSLYHIEKNEHDAALDIFDTEISKNLANESTLDMVDLVSMLFRLKLDYCQVSLQERWYKIKETFKKRSENHGYVLNDAHVFMALSESGDERSKDLFTTSLKSYLGENNLDNSKVNPKSFLKTINRNLGEKVFDSIAYFNEGDFSKVVQLLYPIRYEIIKIGGSNAQRDMFHQMLIQAALRSSNERDNAIGIRMINERLAIRPNSKLTSRIKARFATQFSEV